VGRERVDLRGRKGAKGEEHGAQQTSHNKLLTPKCCQSSLKNFITHTL
jgi:hypothetical protein